MYPNDLLVEGMRRIGVSTLFGGAGGGASSHPAPPLHSRPAAPPPASLPPVSVAPAPCPVCASPPPCLCAPPVLPWPCALPTPSAAAEALLLPALLQGPQRAWRFSEPIHTDRLPPARQARIAAEAARLGFALVQAYSLRRHHLRSAAPHLFEGSEADTLAAATRLEDAVERLLAAHGVPFVTQEGQIRAHAAAAAALGERGAPPLTATPDFLLPRGALINGQPVSWIEVKRFYGAAPNPALRRWLAPVKLHAQVAKYMREWGPHGAVVFEGGYSSAVREALSATVLLLDAALLEADLRGADAAAAGGGGGGGAAQFA